MDPHSGLRGPFGVLLQVPPLADRVAEIGDYLRFQTPTDSLTQRERNIIDVVRALSRDNTVPDALFQRALADLGKERLVELVALAGYYRLIGFILNGFEVDLPERAGPTF